MPSPNKRCSSAPPDNRRLEEGDHNITYRSHSNDRTKSGKLMSVQIYFLDESTTSFQISVRFFKLIFNIKIMFYPILF